MTFRFTREDGSFRVGAGGAAPLSGGDCEGAIDQYGEAEFDGSLHTLIVPSVPCTGASVTAWWLDPDVAGLCDISLHMEGSDLFTASITVLEGAGTCT